MLYLQGAGDPSVTIDSLSNAQEYLRIMLLGLPAFALSQCYAGTLRETGRTTPPMVAGIIAVVTNLIGNAITYTGDDKTVYVNMRTADGFATVEISDTGKGIDKDELEHIWKRYYRSEENHERGIGGSGIGLSIVKGILESHGARYGVESRVGEGSTFWFELDVIYDVDFDEKL